MTASRLGEDGRIARTLAAEARREAGARPLRSSTNHHSANVSVRRPRRLCSAPVMWAARWCWRWRRCRSRCAGSTAAPISFRTTCRRMSSTVRTAEHVRELRSGAAQCHDRCHDPLPSARLRHHRSRVALRVFEFVGLIGSETKRARFVKLGAAGRCRQPADRPAGLSDRHRRDQRQGAGDDRGRACGPASDRARTRACVARQSRDTARLNRRRRARGRLRRARPFSPPPSSAKRRCRCERSRRFRRATATSASDTAR